MNGTPFSVDAVLRQKDLHLLTSETSQYRVTERTTKHFCSACGTPIFNSNPTTYKGLAMVYVGTVEDPQRHVPAMNIFCESKLDWVIPNIGGKVFYRSPSEA
ncbi:GFA family protein [Ramlibacter tataouinensis]|nr:GFA family protein [Ramlibacter tataouinensis]WBY02404.1 GFA family protein [Ramlibacter tataouinensis]